MAGAAQDRTASPDRRTRPGGGERDRGAGWPLRLAIALSVAVAFSSLRYLSLDPAMAPPPLRASMIANGWIFVAHAAFGALALGVGGFQFLPGLRARRPRLHRWLGRVYVASCLASALAGLWIAPYVESGAAATAGFAALAALWLFFTVEGFRNARAARFADHRRWMILSFALTFSAVTLRLQIFAFGAFGLGYDDVSRILAWSCWVPNLIVAALILRGVRFVRPVLSAKA